MASCIEFKLIEEGVLFNTYHVFRNGMFIYCTTYWKGENPEEIRKAEEEESEFRSKAARKNAKAGKRFVMRGRRKKVESKN